MIRNLALVALLATASTVSFAEGDVTKGDPAKGQTLVMEKTCLACHGADGNSPASAFPNLAGQGPAYITKQLTNFKAGTRKDPNMDPIVPLVEPEDIPHLAAWLSQQRPAGIPAIQASDEQIVRGRNLWRAGDAAKGVPACAACHGPSGAGLDAQYPKLSGQYPEYTEKQLQLFRNGERTNDPEGMMRAIAERLSDKDIKAVSAYAAGLR
ncbi:MAG: cytochrome c [Zoogloeaceae bacterium]|jgi:cytochrome c553|nr:cytochrome c [Zoogloeaceae bacterium]